MVERADVKAALEARKELGADYEDEVVDSLLAKIEKRLDKPLAPVQHVHTDPRIVLGSIALGVGATAIATGNGAAWLAVIAWIAIAVVNVAHALRR